MTTCEWDPSTHTEGEGTDTICNTSWEDATQPWDPLDSDGEEEDFEDTVYISSMHVVRDQLRMLSFQIFDD